MDGGAQMRTYWFFQDGRFEGTMEKRATAKVLEENDKRNAKNLSQAGQQLHERGKWLHLY